MNSPTDSLNGYETRVVIDFFMYYMKGDMRNKLMNEFPIIYNKLCEREIMGTVNLTREE